MIRVYVLPNCPKCEELKRYMRSKKVRFEEINIGKDSKALARMTMRGIDEFPTLEINGVLYTDTVASLKRLL